MIDSLKYRTIIRCFNSLKIILFELDQLRPNCRNFELKYLENTVNQEYFQLVSLYYLKQTPFLSVWPLSSYREPPRPPTALAKYSLKLHNFYVKFSVHSNLSF